MWRLTTAGKVQKAQDPLTGEDAMMISIFMNVFNVHSQKSPVAGRVEEIVYKPGPVSYTHLDVYKRQLLLRELVVRGRPEDG